MLSPKPCIIKIVLKRIPSKEEGLHGPGGLVSGFFCANFAKGRVRVGERNESHGPILEAGRLKTCIFMK